MEALNVGSAQWRYMCEAPEISTPRVSVPLTADNPDIFTPVTILQEQLIDNQVHEIHAESQASNDDASEPFHNGEAVVAEPLESLCSSLAATRSIIQSIFPSSHALRVVGTSSAQFGRRDVHCASMIVLSRLMPVAPSRAAITLLPLIFLLRRRFLVFTVATLTTVGALLYGSVFAALSGLLQTKDGRSRNNASLACWTIALLKKTISSLLEARIAQSRRPVGVIRNGDEIALQQAWLLRITDRFPYIRRASAADAYDLVEIQVTTAQNYLWSRIRPLLSLQRDRRFTIGESCQLIFHLICSSRDLYNFKNLEKIADDLSTGFCTVEALSPDIRSTPWSELRFRLERVMEELSLAQIRDLEDCEDLSLAMSSLVSCWWRYTYKQSHSRSRIVESFKHSTSVPIEGGDEAVPNGVSTPNKGFSFEAQGEDPIPLQEEDDHHLLGCDRPDLPPDFGSALAAMRKRCLIEDEETIS